jgi:thiopeptide-type bacteriocin biosynthesis protein
VFKEQPEWSAFHIFHAGDLDEAIVEAVQPLVRRLCEEQSIAGYFFVRYWNGGPHLRLRLRCRKRRAAVEATVLDELGRFLGAMPAPSITEEEYAAQGALMERVDRRLYKACGRTPEATEPLQPPNSIQPRPYCAEVERYGGPVAVDCVHAHFFQSSTIAMAAVAGTPGRMMSRFTLALHLAAALHAAAGWSPEVTSGMFSEVAAGLGSIDPDAALGRFGFPPFEQQRDALGDIACQLRSFTEIPGQSTAFNYLLGIWHGDLAARSLQLAAWEGEGRLALPSRYILMDFLHMMINRLGFGARHEFYIYYLLSHMLAELSPTGAIEDSAWLERASLA